MDACVCLWIMSLSEDINLFKKKKKKIVDIQLDTIKSHLDFEPTLLGCKVRKG